MPVQKRAPAGEYCQPLRRADEPECGATERQLDIFNTFCEGKPGMRSIAASGGILLWPQSHFDWARPGIILYGVSPLENKPWGPDMGFQPVMSLVSTLIAVREHKAGEPVGYGGTWTSERDTRLGVVAMGYGDAIRALHQRVRRCWSTVAR